jgi:hypothetical protein
MLPDIGTVFAITIVLLIILLTTYFRGSRDSEVSIATSYGLDDRGVGVRIPVGWRIFSSPNSSRPALRSTQPPIQWVPGALSPGVKRPGREVDRSPPTSTEVKKMWIYTSTPHTPSWHLTIKFANLPLCACHGSSGQKPQYGLLTLG